MVCVCLSGNSMDKVSFLFYYFNYDKKLVYSCLVILSFSNITHFQYNRNNFFYWNQISLVVLSQYRIVQYILHLEASDSHSYMGCFLLFWPVKVSVCYVFCWKSGARRNRDGYGWKVLGDSLLQRGKGANVTSC